MDSPEQMAEGLVRTRAVFEPDPDAAAACEEKYRKYLRIHEGLAYIMDGIRPGQPEAESGR